MEGLGEADFRKVLNAIEILEKDLDYAAFPDRLVDAIAVVLEVDLISYNEVDPATGASRFLLKPDFSDVSRGSHGYVALARRFDHHPIVAQRVSQTADRALASFVNRLRLLGMVGNCCGEAELRLNIGVTISATGSPFIGVALNRSVRDFDDRDAACIELLKPHMVSAYRNARRFADVHDNLSAGVLPATDRPLTPRESQVLYWVSMGKTNEEVAQIVGAKPLTIKKHLEHIYDKLGVPNRTAAARLSRGLQPS